MSKVRPEDYVDPQYARMMKQKKGSKLIQILRELTEGVMTITGIARETSFSVSEVKKLVSFGIEKQYIERCGVRGGVRRKPGKPRRGESEKETGRPPNYYYLSEDGVTLIRFDPEVRDRWDNLEGIYGEAYEHTLFDSYYALILAIRQHPKLKKYLKAGNFMEYEMQRTIFSPFIFGNDHGMCETELYDDLVKLIEANVRPEHALSYYLALEGTQQEFDALVKRHKLLMEKMRKMPEVQKYLRERSSQ